MALHFRRPFDDTPSARVTERTGDYMLFAQCRRPGCFYGKVDHLMGQLGAEQFHLGCIDAHVHFLVGVPRRRIGQI